MEAQLRSLRGMRTMPIPDRPRVENYGKEAVGLAHEVHLFPAVIRDKVTVETEAVFESGQSTCFFHPKLPATGLCDVSGRMICDLCKTEWQGKTVSFEALQSLLAKGGKIEKERARTKWDDIALAIVLLSMILGPFMLLSSIVVIGICLFQWRKGPTSLMRRSRWRYGLAMILALLQLVGGGMMVYAMFFAA